MLRTRRMSMDPVTLLLLTLVAVAGLLFIGGIIAAGVLSLRNKPAAMPAFPAQAITVIGGILSTNLGAILGLSVAENVGLSAINAEPWYALTSENLQIGAAYLYIGGLLLAFLFWLLNRFSDKPDQVVSTLPELTKTLLGVLVGALAVALGVSQT